MGVTCFLLLSLGLAITAQGQSCSRPVGGPNMSLKDDSIVLDTFEDGSKVSFACNIGYMSAGGSSIVTCTAGKWSPVRLQCQKKNCGYPGEIENGYIDFSEGIEFGDKIVIICDEGYKFAGKQGPREIFCGDQGWDERLPVCEVVVCFPPNTSSYVNLSPSKDIYSYREVVRYSCPQGLSLNGSNTASCLDDGTFIPDPPTCVKVQCADIQIQNGEKVGGSKPPYGHQDTVTFKCKTGYKMREESTVTCDINSQWSPKLPECETVTCEPKRLTGMTLSPNKELYSYGDVVQYSCPKDFKLIASESCSHDGTFKLDPPKCIIVTCKPPEKVANGTFSPVKDSYNIGDVVQYSCQRGFRLTGPTSVSCLSTETFDSAPPVCTKIQCEDVEIPNGEKVGGSKPTYEHQDTVTFKCISEYTMIGESTVTCDINSQWSPRLPECVYIYIGSGFSCGGY